MKMFFSEIFLLIDDGDRLFPLAQSNWKLICIIHFFPSQLGPFDLIFVGDFKTGPSSIRPRFVLDLKEKKLSKPFSHWPYFPKTYAFWKVKEACAIFLWYVQLRSAGISAHTILGLWIHFPNVSSVIDGGRKESLQQWYPSLQRKLHGSQRVRLK